MSIEIRGYSDDIIQVVGNGFSEEFWAYDEEVNYLAFGDGTLLDVRYTSDGLWRINCLAPGACTYSKIEASDPDQNYSDVATLEGFPKWVTCGKGYQKSAI